MNYRKICLIVAVIVFTSTPFIVHADYQISPNPNPSTATITVNTSGAYNSYTPFNNNGLINITSTGTLTNNSGGILNNNSDGTL